MNVSVRIVAEECFARGFENGHSAVSSSKGNAAWPPPEASSVASEKLAPMRDRSRVGDEHRRKHARLRGNPRPRRSRERASRGAFEHGKGRTMNIAERMSGAVKGLARDPEKALSEAHPIKWSRAMKAVGSIFGVRAVGGVR